MVTAAQRPEVADRFGPQFADAVFALEPGTWAGPIASAYGQHLVLVTEHAAARLPGLAEVIAMARRHRRYRRGGRSGPGFLAAARNHLEKMTTGLAPGTSL